MHAYVHIYDNQTNVKLHSWFPPFVSFRSFPPPGFFLLTMFAKDLTGCFSHCCVESIDHSIQICIFIVYDDVRRKLPAYRSLEGFQHIGIFQLFEVKPESCVFWLADSFQAKVEGHHQQIVVTSSVCSWKTSCSSWTLVHSWSEVLLH